MTTGSRTHGKALRLLEVAERLRLRPHGVAELARHFGVTRRTIERDLDALRAMGHGVTEDGHRYALPDKPAALNDVEALAVHSATRLLLHTGVGERHHRMALEKLARQLPEPARTPLIRAVERLEPAPHDRLLDLVAQAWFQRRVLRCTYHGARSGSRRRLDLEPWFYEVSHRNLEPYLIAFDRTHAQAVRVYKVARMHDARLTSERYEVPADFDPHALLEGSWGMVVGPPVVVRLAVSPQVAFWFEERRPRGQALHVTARHEDGSLEVEVHGNLAADGDVHELMAFLLGWGRHVQVLGPEEVRLRVAEELQAAAARYDPATS